MIDHGTRDEILLDHLINLTEQVRLLAAACRQHGIDIPKQIGTLGPASEEVVARLIKESIKCNFLDKQEDFIEETGDDLVL